LLRVDVHRHFDAGYVTVTLDYAFRVSSRFRGVCDNGKVYYALDGRTIWTPSAPYPKLDRERLKRYEASTFLGV
jgi:hypothetical protein